MNKNEVLSELYYGIESRFGSAKSLYDDAIKKGLVITQQEVNDWLKNQSLKQRKITRITTVIQYLLVGRFIVLI